MRGVGGEKANAQAILDKIEYDRREKERERRNKVREQKVYFGITLENATKFEEPYLAYWGVAERMAAHIISTELGHKNFHIPDGQGQSFSFSGTDIQRENIQRMININVRKFITTIEYSYQKFAQTKGINTDENTSKYKRDPAACRNYFLSLNGIIDETLMTV